MNLLKWPLAFLLSLGLVWNGQAYPLVADAQAGCTFKLGFQTIASLIPDAVGTCLENEQFNVANGNAEQRTSRGLLVWRKADNWTAFTNGHTTWINGPNGLESRLNSERFAWENDPVVAPGGPPPASPPGVASPASPLSPPATDPPVQEPDEPMATPSANGWARVVQVTTPETLLVENAAGQRFAVSHIGILGPAEAQQSWRGRSTEEHARRLAPGARVWLVGHEGLANPDGVSMRHVLLDGDPKRPVAAELLRAGTVWVYPHSMHAYVESYADRQAEAVTARSGAWAEVKTSAVFRPRGESHGGLPINPRLARALQALDANDRGHALLAFVNRFPVEVGLSETAENVVAYFHMRNYSIQIGEGAVSAAPESIAAVLIHELTHTKQLIRRFVYQEHPDCFAREVEAFEATALYWQSVHGREGKKRPNHWLDYELNNTLKQYQGHDIEDRVARSYVHQCKAA